MIATIRSDAVNLPLLLHVGGAAVLVGAVLVAAWAFFSAARGGDAAVLARTGFRTLLIWALPAYVVMRAAAQWVYSKENLDAVPGGDPAWVGIGFGVSDLGLLLLIVAAVVTGIGARRLRDDAGASGTLVRVGAFVCALLLVLYVVAVWAMTTKPT